MASNSPAENRRVAVAQLCSSSSKLSNLLDVARCAGMAREKNASMLFLPECFGFMGSSSLGSLTNAEPAIEGPPIPTNEKNVNDLLQREIEGFANTGDAKSAIKNHQLSLLDGLKFIAKETGLWISAGGMHEKGAPPHTAQSESDDSAGAERMYNTHVVIDKEGIVKATYRKIHLFDVSLANVNLQESKTTAPGTSVVLCDSPIGRLGLTTCYDLRFPELYAELVRRGAQILLVPSAFTVPTGQAHWHILLRARAIETQCYVLAAAQCGQHNQKRASYGHSLVVDPWGKVQADAGNDPTNIPTIVVCDIDLETVEKTRQNMPIQQHRKAASEALGLSVM